MIGARVLGLGVLVWLWVSSDAHGNPLSDLRQQVADAHARRVQKLGERMGVNEGPPMLVSDIHDLTDYIVSAPPMSILPGRHRSRREP